jgi:hypothetical protein
MAVTICGNMQLGSDNGQDEGVGAGRNDGGWK